MSIPELVALAVVLLAVDLWLARWLRRNVRPGVLSEARKPGT